MMRAAGSDGVRNVDRVLPPTSRREESPRRREPRDERERRRSNDEPDPDADEDATEPSLPGAERPRVDVRV